MARLLVNCPSEEDFARLKALLETTSGVSVAWARSEAEVARSIQRETVHLFIRDSQRSVDVDLEFARALRRTGFARPVVMITETLGDPRLLDRDHGFCLVERPVDPKVIRGLVSKLLINRSVPAQLSRRYDVALKTTLETFVSGARFTTQMCNVSRGGAYLEVSARPTVRVGDLVRLRVWLDDFDRERVVSGRVVWLTSRGHAAGGFGLGLKFLKSSDLYRNVTEPAR